MNVTRELVRDPCEILFEDGKRYATQRWITRCADIRPWIDCVIDGVHVVAEADFGWVRIGEPFPTEDSVPSILYEPPRLPWWRRLAEVFR